MLRMLLEGQLSLPRGIVSTVMKEGAEAHYTRFATLPKRRLIRSPYRVLKKRTIYAPSEDLKRIQEAIARLVSSKFTAHPIAHAYERGRSIFTNARQHVGARSIIKIDFVDFFGSISRQSVIDAIRVLLDDFNDQDIKAIAALCCYGGRLPQGSPSSPVLSNLVCHLLDEQLDDLAREHGCIVTRYSDDITFSTPAKAFPSALAKCWKNGVHLESPICSLLERQGFAINASKLKFQTRPGRLKITGLVVNGGVSVPREFRHNLRAGLHQWKKFGLNACARAHTNGCILAFANSLRGSIEHIGQAQGRDCGPYQQALATFEELRFRDRVSLMAAERTLAAARNAKGDNVISRRIG